MKSCRSVNPIFVLVLQTTTVKRIFKEPSITSYTRGRSLKDILVRAKLWARLIHVVEVVQACQPHFCKVNPTKNKSNRVVTIYLANDWGKLGQNLNGCLHVLISTVLISNSTYSNEKILQVECFSMIIK